jgi:alpha-glucosidase
VIYESPLTVVCDHPDNILNKAGSDFLKIVPTTWDDIKFIGGYPGDYVAIAKRSGSNWSLGVMNNSIGKSVDINLNFLPGGNYTLEMWADSKKSDKEPMELTKSDKSVKSGDKVRITLAKNGGFVGVIRPK